MTLLETTSQAHSSRRMVSRSILDGAIYVAELSYAVAGKKVWAIARPAGHPAEAHSGSGRVLTMPFATLDGIKTHYVQQGSGP